MTVPSQIETDGITLDRVVLVGEAAMRFLAASIHGGALDPTKIGGAVRDSFDLAEAFWVEYARRYDSVETPHD